MQIGSLIQQCCGMQSHRFILIFIAQYFIIAVYLAIWISWVEISTITKEHFFRTKMISFQSDPESNPIELIIVLTLVVGSLLATFALGELGKWITSKSLTPYDILCQCDWYLLPVELQRKLTLVMLSSQQPLVIFGYGNVPCARETFKRVKQTQFLFQRVSFSKFSWNCFLCRQFVQASTISWSFVVLMGEFLFNKKNIN